jgi:CheY-specific phosphatase CheX
MANIYEQIHAVIVRIMEDWALMLVEQAEANTSIFELEQPFYVSQVSFKGVVNGRYSIVCQSEFGKTLATNLLGMEEEISDSQIKDALKEMINVMSGNLLTDTYGADNVFNLTSPEVTTAGAEEVERLFERPHFCYLGDDQPVAVSFVLEEMPDEY